MLENDILAELPLFDEWMPKEYMVKPKHGTNLVIKDLDLRYRNLPFQPQLVNDYDINRTEELERLNNMLYIHFDTDSIDEVPSCTHGCTRGRYYLTSGENQTICRVCDTPVTDHTTQTIGDRLWMEARDGMPSFMLPVVWSILKSSFTFKRFDCLKYLTTPTMTVPAEQKGIEARIKKYGFPRGWSHFEANFDAIIEMLVDERLFVERLAKRKNKGMNELLAFIHKHRKRIFTRHLPVPSNINFVTEDTSMGKFSDNTLNGVIEGIRTFSSIVWEELSDSVRESRFALMHEQLAAAYEHFNKTRLSKKTAWIRSRTIATNPHFSFRSVIVSNHAVHRYDEIHVPWVVACGLLKLHLLGQLIQQGYSANSALDLIYRNMLRYDPNDPESQIIKGLFDRFINEAIGGKGIPVFFHRNPMLKRAGIQRLFITKVKTDVEDHTISMSTLILKGANADFDGDNMNGLLLLDERQFLAAERFAPHHNVMSMSEPFRFDGIMKQPPQITTMEFKYLAEEEDHYAEYLDKVSKGEIVEVDLFNEYDLKGFQSNYELFQ